MSTVIFIGTQVPENYLIRQHKFKYFPDKEMKDKILSDLANHSKIILGEDLRIEINVEISIKEYQNKRPDKLFWYENQQDASKNI